MKFFNILSALALTASLSVRCSPQLQPFTANTLQEVNNSEENLKKIQFYLSEDVVIYRDVTRQNGDIIAGKIKIVQGREVEEVRIPKGTPGVFLFRVKDKNFAISFDEGNDKRYLTFGPNPKRGGTYVLLATDWKDRQGKVHYDDKVYWAAGESAFASLLVDLDKVRKTETQSRVAGGRKVQ
jgi:hypothetical protein